MMTKGLPSQTIAAATPRPTKYMLKEGVEPEDVLRLLRAEEVGIYRRVLEQLVIKRLDAQLEVIAEPRDRLHRDNALRRRWRRYLLRGEGWIAIDGTSS